MRPVGTSTAAGQVVEEQAPEDWCWSRLIDLNQTLVKLPALRGTRLLRADFFLLFYPDDVSAQ